MVESALLHAERVVVVDDASQDNTAKLAEAAGAAVLRLPVQLGAWSVKASILLLPWTQTASTRAVIYPI